MKATLKWLIIGSFLFATSCGEDTSGDDIALIYEYLFFSDAHGNDITQLDTVNTFKNFAITQNGFSEIYFADTVLVEGKMIYEVFGFGEYTNYVELNGSDIDTIDRVVQPPGAANFSEVDIITYYYNGEEMATLDFIADPDLKREIAERNTQYLREETTNPFYVTLVKR